jgi:hypothetical protein
MSWAAPRCSAGRRTHRGRRHPCSAQQRLVLILGRDPLPPLAVQQAHPGERVAPGGEAVGVDGPVERLPQGDEGVVDGLGLVRPRRLLADHVGRLHQRELEVVRVRLGDRAGRPVAVDLGELGTPPLVVLEGVLVPGGLNVLQEEDEQLGDGHPGGEAPAHLLALLFQFGELELQEAPGLGHPLLNLAQPDVLPVRAADVPAPLLVRLRFPRHRSLSCVNPEDTTPARGGCGNRRGAGDGPVGLGMPAPKARAGIVRTEVLQKRNRKCALQRHLRSRPDWV